MYEIWKEVYNIYPLQLDEAIWFHLSTQTAGWRANGCWWQEPPGKLFAFPNTYIALFTECHLHNVLQRGELRQAAGMHPAAPQIHWVLLCCARRLRCCSVMDQFIKLLFHLNQFWNNIHFLWVIMQFWQVSLQGCNVAQQTLFAWFFVLKKGNCKSTVDVWWIIRYIQSHNVSSWKGNRFV